MHAHTQAKTNIIHVVNNSNTQLLHTIPELQKELTFNSGGGGGIAQVSSIKFSGSVLACPPMEGTFILSLCYFIFRGYLNWLSAAFTHKKPGESSCDESSGSEQKRQREALAGSYSGKGAVKKSPSIKRSESAISCEQW